MLAQLVGEGAPRALVAIAAKARHERASERYQDVEALAADLARFRNQDPVEAYRESSIERLVRLYRRYELPILLILAYIVMRFVLLVWRGV
jgi:hypothetical protein